MPRFFRSQLQKIFGTAAKRPYRRQPAVLQVEGLEERANPVSIAPGPVVGPMTANWEFDQPGTYTFTSNFTVPTGFTLKIGENAGGTPVAGVNVVINNNAVVTTAGTTKVLAPASFNSQDGGGSQGLAVSAGGKLTITNATLGITGTNFPNDINTHVTVASGGQLQATGTTFGWDVVDLKTGATVNAGDITGNGFDTILRVAASSVTAVTNNLRFRNVELNAGSTFVGGTTLAPIGTVTTANQRYVVPGALTVPSTGGPVTFGPGTSVLIRNNAVVAVNGTLRVDAPASFLSEDFGGNQGIAVAAGGLLDIDNATLGISGTNFPNDINTLVTVVSGGQLQATGTTFGWDVVDLKTGATVNAGDITGNGFDTILRVAASSVTAITNNLRFRDVELNAGSTFVGGTTLAPIGTVTTANQRYVVPGALTVPTGVVTFGPGTSVLIRNNAVVAVNGTLRVDAPASFLSEDFGGNQGIAVANNGLLDIDNATLGISGTNFPNDINTLVTVASGGRLQATGTTFGWDVVDLKNGANVQPNDIVTSAFDTILRIPAISVPRVTNNLRFRDVELNANSTTGTTLSLSPLGTATTANQRYVFPGAFTVATGATMTFTPGVSVLIRNNAIVTVRGTLRVDTPASFLSEDFGGNQGLAVSDAAGAGGLLDLDNVTLGISGTNFPNDINTLVTVNKLGQLQASGTTFGWDVVDLKNDATVQPNDITTSAFDTILRIQPASVPRVTNNLRFRNVELNAGTITGGTNLTLGLLGTATTANQRYVFPGALTVAGGASVAFTPGVSILFRNNAVVTVAGTMTATDPASFLSEDFGGNQGLVVAAGGSLALTRATLGISGTNFPNDINTQLTVNSGGTLDMVGGGFGWDRINVPSGATASIRYISLTTRLAVHSSATVNITQNDFSGMAANAVVATGSSTATIPMPSNFWGTDLASEIDAKILDNLDAPTTRPRVVYTPFLDGQPVLPAGLAATATYSGSAATVTLSATFTSPVGTVNQGTATFTLINSVTLQVVGIAQSNTVSNGFTSVVYNLPAGTAGGTYIIQISYTDPGGFFSDSTDSSQVLTINAAAATGAAANASGTFSVSGQSVSLSANITSSAGTVNGGTVTFTIMNGATVIGIATTSTVVVNGVATVNYNLPPGLAAGTYTIAISYSGTTSFQAFTGTAGTLTIGAAASVMVTASASSGFSVIANTVTLNATVSSSAGTVNGGTVTFTVMQGATVIGTATTSTAVVSGAASVNYPLPAGTNAGAYTITAVYNGSTNFTTSTASNQTLTVTQASTASVAVNATAVVTAGSQVVVLTANVTTASGPVNSGTVTFTVRQGATVIGMATTSGTVVNGVATANYTLPAGTVVGSYTIAAVYNGTTNLAISTATSGTLQISAAAATVATTNATAAFSLSAQTVSLTATVTSAAGVVNEGTVTFTIRQGATVIGTATTSGTVSAGSASVNYSLPAGTGAGTLSITAEYNGTSNFGSSTDNTRTLTINTVASTVAAVAATGTYAVGGQSLTLSAGVTSAAGVVNQGTITFVVRQGATVIGTAATSGTVSGGTASVSYALPAGTSVGTYSITAVYNGTANITTSTDATQTLTLSAASSTVAAANASVAVAAGSQVVSLTATVTSAAGVVNQGTVTFTVRQGATVIGTAATSGTVSGGSASVNYTLPAGTTNGVYTVDVTYNGTANITTSADTATLTVATAATVTGTDATATFSGSGQSVTLTATVTSTAGVVNEGTVTFTVLQGATVVGVAVSGAVSAGAATASYALPAGTPAGSLTVRAAYSGTANFTTATDDAALTVNAAATSVSIQPATSTYRTAVGSANLQAEVTSPAGTVSTGTVTFTIRQGSTVVGTPVTADVGVLGGVTGVYIIPSHLPVGAYTIEAVFNGTSDLAVSGGTQTFTVEPAFTTTTPRPATATVGAAAVAVDVSAFVSSTTAAITAGTVTFTVLSGSTVIGTPVTVSVTTNEVPAVYTLPGGTAGGTYTIRAEYSGMPNVSGNSGTNTLTVTSSLPTKPPATLIGFTQFAVGADAGGAGSVTVYNPDATAAYTLGALPGTTGARTAVGDFNGDGVPDLAVGTGPGVLAEVRVYDGATRQELFATTPFPDFVGGVFVAAGDVNGDGKADLVITPDEGGGPRVTILRGADFATLANFFGIDDPAFRGGARAALGDLTGDGLADLVVSAGFGGGPRVAGFDGAALTAGNTTTKLFGDFFLFEPALRNGAYVSVGDLDGDGFADIIGGGGPGGGPRVLALDGRDLMTGTTTVLANFFGGVVDNRGGIRVTAKDLDGDSRADIVVGAGSGAGSRVTGYLGKDFAGGTTAPAAFDFDALPGFNGGVFVG